MKHLLLLTLLVACGTKDKPKSGKITFNTDTVKIERPLQLLDTCAHEYVGCVILLDDGRRTTKGNICQKCLRLEVLNVVLHNLDSLNKIYRK